VRGAVLALVLSAMASMSMSMSMTATVTATARATATAGASPLQETRGGVAIDWGEGTLTAAGGAAADLRMPSADLARPGAERRARAAALARLKSALGELPLGGDRTLPPAAVELALGRARLLGVEYQSNGGALVRMQVRFSDWLPAQAPVGPALSVAEMRLQGAPKLKIGGKETLIGAARYQLGAPPAGTRALAAKADRQGRLVVAVAAADRDLGEKLAGAAIVIYVDKVLR
jgi:hypothetical protein